jgi:hypothetical protein
MPTAIQPGAYPQGGLPAQPWPAGQMVSMQQLPMQVQQQMPPPPGWQPQGAPMQIPQQQIVYMDPQGQRQQPMVQQYIGQPQQQQVMLPQSPSGLSIQRQVRPVLQDHLLLANMHQHTCSVLLLLTLSANACIAACRAPQQQPPPMETVYIDVPRPPQPQQPQPQPQPQPVSSAKSAYVPRVSPHAHPYDSMSVPSSKVTVICPQFVVNIHVSLTLAHEAMR